MSDFLSARDVQLIASGVDIGLAVDVDETLHLVPISPTVVAEVVGPQAEAVSFDNGLVFWFASGHGPAVNRMATLNLLAASSATARDVALLCGPVLITGYDARGRAVGLTDAHLAALRHGREPSWLGRRILSLRQHRAERRARGRRGPR